jgi:hypothetical protein
MQSPLQNLVIRRLHHHKKNSLSGIKRYHWKSIDYGDLDAISLGNLKSLILMHSGEIYAITTPNPCHKKAPSPQEEEYI